MSILTPFNSLTENISNQVLLMENTLIGNVPSTYYNIEGLDQNEILEFIE